MDGLLIVLIGFIFCYISKKEYIEDADIPVRTNPNFYEDPDAFMRYYHELIK